MSSRFNREGDDASYRPGPRQDRREQRAPSAQPHSFGQRGGRGGGQPTNRSNSSFSHQPSRGGHRRDDPRNADENERRYGQPSSHHGNNQHYRRPSHESEEDRRHRQQSGSRDDRDGARRSHPPLDRGGHGGLQPSRGRGGNRGRGGWDHQRGRGRGREGGQQTPSATLPSTFALLESLSTDGRALVRFWTQKDLQADFFVYLQVEELDESKLRTLFMWVLAALKESDTNRNAQFALECVPAISQWWLFQQLNPVSKAFCASRSTAVAAALECCYKVNPTNDQLRHAIRLLLANVKEADATIGRLRDAFFTNESAARSQANARRLHVDEEAPLPNDGLTEWWTTAYQQWPLFPCEDDCQREERPFQRSLIPVPKQEISSLRNLAILHFHLLREDFVAAIRNGVNYVRQRRTGHQVERCREVRIYEKVVITGVRIDRYEKGLLFCCKIVNPDPTKMSPHFWKKRLMPGNYILLSTPENGFTDLENCYSGLVVRRPTPKFQGQHGRGPPQDPLTQGEFDILFHRNFFEAYKKYSEFQAMESKPFFLPYERTLKALKDEPRWGEIDPKLSRAIISGITARPQYVDEARQSGALWSLDGVIRMKPRAKSSVDVTDQAAWDTCEDWTVEKEKECTKELHVLDKSQRDAMQSVFNNNLALVQGTPGTGKTFLGMKLLQLFLLNRRAIPTLPIIILCYTNHAMDALLESILPLSQVNPAKVVRCGGISKVEALNEFALNKRFFSGKRTMSDEFVNDVEKASQELVELERIDVTKRLSPAAQEMIIECPFVPQSLSDHFQLGLENLEDALKEEKGRTSDAREQIAELQRELGKESEDRVRQEINTAENELRKCTQQHKQAVAELTAAEASVPTLKSSSELDDLTNQKTGLEKVMTDLNLELAELIKDQQLEKKLGATVGAQKRKKNKRGKGNKQKAATPQTPENASKVEDEQKAEEPKQSLLDEKLSELRQQLEEYKGAMKGMDDELAQDRKRRHQVEAIPKLRAKVEQLAASIKGFEKRIKDAKDDLEWVLKAKADLKLLTGELHESERRAAKIEDARSNLLDRWRGPWVKDPSPTTPSQAGGGGGAPPELRVNRVDAEAEQDFDDQEEELELERRAGALDPDDDSDAEFTAFSGNTSNAPQRANLERELDTLANRTTDFNKISPRDRNRIVELLLLLLRDDARRNIEKKCQALERKRAEMEAKVAKEKAKFFREMHLVFMTTSAVALHLDALQLAEPKVVMVEESAEVLESHILACLTPSIQHLILIGDHRQLQPKVESHFLGGRKRLGLSTMERLARLGRTEFVTLHTQRRMHPAISAFTKQYYLRDSDPGDQPIAIEDHPSTENRPLAAVEHDARVVFIDDTIGVENNNRSTDSWENRRQAELSIAIAMYLKKLYDDVPKQRQRDRPDSTADILRSKVTILVPYSGQCLLTFAVARELSFPTYSHNNPSGVRVISVDDYQGEENDFIIFALVRTTELGFLRLENRACVALSRARCGMFIIGKAELFQGPKSISMGPNSESRPHGLWHRMLELCRRTPGGLVQDQFPGWCALHQVPLRFGTMKELRAVVGPEGGCKMPCGKKFEGCQHHCKRTCHGSSPCLTSSNGCTEICGRAGDQCVPPRTCAHPCEESCFKECGSCRVPITFTYPNCKHVAQVPCSDVAKGKIPPCKTRVTAIHSNCGHEVTGECHLWTSEAGMNRLARNCQHPCEYPLPCGHVCGQRCCDCTKEKDHPERVCTYVGDFTLPCGHTARVKCCDRETARCARGNVCKEQSWCGHPCEKPCGHEGAHACKQGKLITLPDCGHAVEVPCSLLHKDGKTPKAEFHCTARCQFQLACGHFCPDVCGTCKSRPGVGWMKHLPCSTPCGRTLFCGHACSSNCDQDCPPCTEICTYRCAHDKPRCDIKQARHKCSDCTKVRCEMPCPWSCPHHRCEKKCWEPCEREQCRLRCEKQLPCGHHCHGVCGERCPAWCPTCSAAAPTDSPPEADQYLRNLYAVINDDDAFEKFRVTGKIDDDPNNEGLVMQLPCRCIFLFEELEYLFNAEATSDEVKPVRCPHRDCNEILYPNACLSFSAVLRKRTLDLQAGREARAKFKATTDQEEFDTETIANNLLGGLVKILPEGNEARNLLSDAAAFDDLPFALDDPPEKPKTENIKVCYSLRDGRECRKKKCDYSHNPEIVARARNYEARVKTYREDLKRYEQKVADRNSKRTALLNNTASSVPSQLQSVARRTLQFREYLVEQTDDDSQTTMVPRFKQLYNMLMILLHDAASNFKFADVNRQLQQSRNADWRLCQDALESALSDKAWDNFLSHSPEELSVLRSKLEWAELLAQALRIHTKASEYNLATHDRTQGTPVNLPKRNFAGEKVMNGLFLEAEKYLQSINSRGRQHLQASPFAPIFLNNTCLLSSCSAFQRFASAVEAQPQSVPLQQQSGGAAPTGFTTFAGRRIRFAVHGTSVSAISSILCRGFDPSRRRGQAHGPGEYFGLNFDISLGYAKGEEALIVAAILDGPWVNDKGTLLVVNNPLDALTSYCLPLGVVILGSRVMQCHEYLACQYPIPAASELQPIITQLRDNVRESAPTSSVEGKVQLEKMEKLISQFEAKMGFSRPSKQQLLDTLAALGLSPRHLFRCSKGHYYFIGECGGAMERSRCPECGETVGGQEHTKVSTTQFAGKDVDENAVTDWA